MKVSKKLIALTGILAGMATTLLMGGTPVSANVDENSIVSQTLDYDYYPESVEDVYAPVKFTLSTVTASDVSYYETSNLSLEEYLVREIKNFNSLINVSAYQVDGTTITDLLNKINLSYPEIFFLSTNFQYSVNTSTGNISKLKLQYSCTKDEYAETIQKIDDKFSEVLSTISDDMSDYEKALLAHDYICTNFSYDTRATSEVNHKLDEFVEDGTGVCQAYMSAYSYILEKLGIKSYPVVSSAINHTWNMVELDGKYYQVDVTWDDFVPDLLGWSQHTNFLLTDEEISSSEHGQEWHTYEDGISATDDTFYSYSYRSLKFPIVNINNRLYCIDNGEFCEYNLSKDVLTPITDLISQCKWYNYHATIKGSYYSEKYSSLNPYKDVIFYNTPNEVIAMDIAGNVLDVVYSRETGNDNIFGITIKDGVLLAQVEVSLNAEAGTFGQNIIEVCNVDEWLQDYLSTSHDTTTDTTTVTSVIETTAVETTTEPPVETTIATTTTSEEVTTTATEVTTVPEVTVVLTNAEDNSISINKYYNNYSLDINRDDTVNGLDLLNLKAYIIHGTKNADYGYDVNNDGSVNILDILILKNIIINMKE